MPTTIESELEVLERGLQRLHVEYERFFTGDAKVPPIDTRRRIEDLLRRMRNENVERAAERFRLQNVQSRFQSLTELWEKRLGTRSEGRTTPGRLPFSRREPAPAGAARDAEGSQSVEKREQADLMPLFERYCAARRSLGEDVSRVRYERFEELVGRQAAEIRRVTGARRLVFEIQTIDGRVRLVGRPAPAKGPS
ncbi:MAG: MXAN_5187 C-terminal domain-containing protein [Acidithiobacillales bacterium]